MGNAVVVAAVFDMVPPIACHGTPHVVPWNPVPRRGMPWGCRGKSWGYYGNATASHENVKQCRTLDDEPSLLVSYAAERRDIADERRAEGRQCSKVQGGLVGRTWLC